MNSVSELADLYAGRKVIWADGSPARIVLRPVSDIESEMVRKILAANGQWIP